MFNRRGLITGLAALVAAPALVKASSLMPLRGEKLAWRPCELRGARLLVELANERGTFVDVYDLVNNPKDVNIYKPERYELTASIDSPVFMHFDDGSTFVMKSKGPCIGASWEEIT